MYRVIQDDYAYKDRQQVGIVKEVQYNHVKVVNDYEYLLDCKNKEVYSSQTLLNRVKDNNDLIEKNIKSLGKKAALIKKQIDIRKERNFISNIENSHIKRENFRNFTYLQKLFCLNNTEKIEDIMSKYKKIRVIHEGNIIYVIALFNLENTSGKGTIVKLL